MSTNDKHFNVTTQMRIYAPWTATMHRPRHYYFTCSSKKTTKIYWQNNKQREPNVFETVCWFHDGAFLFFLSFLFRILATTSFQVFHWRWTWWLLRALHHTTCCRAFVNLILIPLIDTDGLWYQKMYKSTGGGTSDRQSNIGLETSMKRIISL